MIRFEEGDNRFNYRVVGIAIHNGCVLLHQAEGDGFWTCPGGRAEFGESAEQTLKREMLEEINEEVEVLRLLWFVENFFSYDGKRYHEIALYFLMQLPETSAHLSTSGSFQGREAEAPLTFQWFPVHAQLLAGLPLLPAFLQTELQSLPSSLRHVVQRDA